MNTNKNETRSKVKIFYIVIPQHYACRLSINHIHDEIIPYSYSIIPGAHSLFRQHGMKYTEGAKNKKIKLWYIKHDDVIKWNIFRVTGHLRGEFTGHRWIPSTKASDVELYVFFICDWINGWVNNREAGDLRRNCAHYDVNVMMQ